VIIIIIIIVSTLLLLLLARDIDAQWKTNTINAPSSQQLQVTFTNIIQFLLRLLNTTFYYYLLLQIFDFSFKQRYFRSLMILKSEFLGTAGAGHFTDF